MDFVDEVGNDFTPAVADIEVEVIFFTLSACKKVVNDDGSRGGGLYSKRPFCGVGGRRVTFLQMNLLKISGILSSVYDTSPTNVLGPSKSILMTRQFHLHLHLHLYLLDVAPLASHAFLYRSSLPHIVDW